MHSLNLSLNDAYDHVKACKPNISPNFSFMGQLMDYERSLRLERDVNCVACSRAAAAAAAPTTASVVGYSRLVPDDDDATAAGEMLDDVGLLPCVCQLVDSLTYFSSPASSISSLSSAAATSSSSSATSSSAFDYEISSTHT